MIAKTGEFGLFLAPQEDDVICLDASTASLHEYTEEIISADDQQADLCRTLHGCCTLHIMKQSYVLPYRHSLLISMVCSCPVGGVIADITPNDEPLSTRNTTFSEFIIEPSDRRCRTLITAWPLMTK